MFFIHLFCNLVRVICHFQCLCYITQEPEKAADVTPLTAEEREERARRIVESRVLSQEEFKQIQQRQLAKHVSTDKKTSGGRKRSRPDDDVDKAAHEYDS